MFRRPLLTPGKQSVKYLFEYFAGATIVRVGKRAPGDALKAEVIPFALLASEARLNIPKALEPPRLRKQQYNELLPAVQTLAVPVAVVAVNTFFEVIPINQLHQLGKYRMFDHRAKSFFVSQNLKFFLILMIQRF